MTKPDDGKHVSFGNDRDASEDTIDEQEVDDTLRKFTGGDYNPSKPNGIVVGRLSRWEGGNQINNEMFNRPAKTKGDYSENDDEEDPEQHPKVKFRDVVRVFRNSNAMMEVTNEDIERVKIMHGKFLEGSQFSFNYNALLLIASIIAALGLGSNSVATIIASMLVSPLMGPVVGIAYANTIHDYKMFRIAIVTEVVSLVVCIVIGLAVGACMLPFSVSDDWPTDEMYNRGTMTSFYVGFPVAFFSGLGVAVSLLDEQTSSLVGVAISASLLPPAVNAGMLWVSYFAYDPTNHPDSTLDKVDFRLMGLTSLGLTLINIVLIIISSMIMFRMKERLPINKSIFWSDLGVARKIYSNLAIIPRIQEGPSQAEIRKRMTQLVFPRVSAVDYSKYAKDSVTPKNRKSKFQVPHGSAELLNSISEEQNPSTMETIGEEDPPLPYREDAKV